MIDRSKWVVRGEIELHLDERWKTKGILYNAQKLDANSSSPAKSGAFEYQLNN